MSQAQLSSEGKSELTSVDVAASRLDHPVAPGFWAVIPAGGAGTRLWPLSRATRPKFLLPLLGATSLLQDTLTRLGPLAPPERTLVVCGPAHAAAVARLRPLASLRSSAWS
jgi:mannose-1-phosphate guanylyltransferase